MAPFVAFAAALLSVLAFIPRVRDWAFRIGFVDRPASRKVHDRPMPLGGGLAIAAGVLIGTAAAAVMTPRGVGLAGGPGLRFAVAMAVGLLASVVLGLLDDRRPLAPAMKLAGQVAAAAILVLGSGRPDPHALGGAAVPLALIGVVALMNACNFLDNMDGLLGGIALVCGLSLAIAAPNAATADPVLLLATRLACATAGAAAGFLAHNFPPARLFMGDAGSLALGFLLAAALLGIVPAELPLHPGVGLVIILAYPLFDLLFVTITRIRAGRKVWTPGRDHTTHRLHQRLGTARRTAVAVYLLTAFAAGAGIALCRWPGPVSVLAASAGAMLLFGLGVRLARVPPA
jgi:UDP-GlcNAc:undecaprenyl-phosphate GlcNAc-1-phosphate transferase